MIQAVCSLVAVVMVCFPVASGAQEIHEYEVRRTLSPIQIDGRLTEPEWDAAPLTETFVKYADGASVRFPTQAKLLWDDTNLYIAFICTDPDVWANFTTRDAHLWEEEVVETFIDPDGDGIDYMEIHVNPLGTQLDLLMSKAYSVGGTGDFGWNLEGYTSAVWVDGTANNPEDTDTRWVAEIALPFAGLAFSAPSLVFPPKSGDSWRINLCRYEYERSGLKETEISAWNQTDKRGFHAPDKFGRIIFSASPVLGPVSVDGAESAPYAFGITGNYPNPFNLSTTISFTLPSSGSIELDLYSIVGQHCRTLASGTYSSGIHTCIWDGTDAAGAAMTSGVYILRLRNGTRSVSHAMLLLK